MKRGATRRGKQRKGTRKHRGGGKNKTPLSRKGNTSNTGNSAYFAANDPANVQKQVSLTEDIEALLTKYSLVLKGLESKPYSEAFFRVYGKQLKEAQETFDRDIEYMRTYDVKTLEKVKRDLERFTQGLGKKLESLNFKRGVMSKMNLSKATPYEAEEQLRNLMNWQTIAPRSRGSSVATNASDPKGLAP